MSETSIADHVDPSVQILRRFRVVFNAVKAHFRSVEKTVGIGGAQLWALSIISSNDGIGVKELARAMDMHQSTASNLVKGLIDREFVIATKNAADRRTVKLSLLPSGAVVLDRAPGPFAGLLPKALSSLDAQTLARLDEDLARVIAALDAEGHAGT